MKKPVTFWWSLLIFLAMLSSVGAQTAPPPPPPVAPETTVPASPPPPPPAVTAAPYPAMPPLPPPPIPEREVPPPPAGAIIADFLFVRPIAFAATIVGTGMMIASLPISLPSRSVGTCADVLVARPFSFTFMRPLGTFPQDYGVWP